MFDNSWPGWSLAQSAISASAGLLGVFAGSWMTAHNQAAERKRDRVKEQLRDYYAPLLALRKDIQAKSELRLKIHSSANSVWQELMENARQEGKLVSVIKENEEKFNRIFAYSDEQLKTDLIPLYETMLELYSKNLWLAEKSTLQFHGDLAEFVEIWRRFLSGSLPGPVAQSVGHSEEKLKDFYEDIEHNCERLGAELKK
jgi:hypothetical protein